MGLKPGNEIKLSCYAYAFGEDLDISELVQLTEGELKEKECASVEKEKNIYRKIEDAIAEWKKQAAETIHLQKAQEYLKTTAVEHTENQWSKKEDTWILSNMVYKMTYRINEISHGSNKKRHPIHWELTWSLVFNTPSNSDFSGRRSRIAGQRNKKFTDKAEMEKYLKGRIQAYAHLFTEIFPPIPKEQEGYFCVNGILLPGYTIESPELLEPDKDHVDDLLSLLSDMDIDGEAQEQLSAPQAEEKTPEAIWSRNRQQRQRSGKPPQSPAR